jgi:multidrug transporter EmrE-like cation transporter
MKTPLSSILLVILGSFIGSFGAVFLKFGSEKLRGGLAGILNVRLAAGVSMYLLSTVFFIAALRNGELSVLYPLVSIGSIWTLVWSKIFFKEPLTGYKFVGVFLILVGVTFIGLGNR